MGKRLRVFIYPSVVSCIIPNNMSKQEIEKRAYELFEDNVQWEFRVEEEVECEQGLGDSLRCGKGRNYPG